jgi:catechol 2,3-dioxygenase-like lactoylglutathione lyase family enzyme
MVDQRQTPLLSGIDCIRFPVPDLAVALEFYRDRLGHELVWRTADTAGLRMPGSAAEIVLYTDPSPLPPEIDFLVDSADEAATHYLAAGGHIVVEPFDIQIGRAVVVEDPWGNQYVLLDMSKGLLITDAEGNIIGNEV